MPPCGRDTCQHEVSGWRSQGSGILLPGALKNEKKAIELLAGETFEALRDKLKEFLDTAAALLLD